MRTMNEIASPPMSCRGDIDKVEQHVHAQAPRVCARYREHGVGHAGTDCRLQVVRYFFEEIEGDGMLSVRQFDQRNWIEPAWRHHFQDISDVIAVMAEYRWHLHTVLRFLSCIPTRVGAGEIT